MAAAILILLVVVELALSVWVLTRFNGLRKEAAIMAKSYDALTDAILNWSDNETPVKLPDVALEQVESAADVLSNASDEQVAAALDILKSLGHEDKAEV